MQPPPPSPRRKRRLLVLTAALTAAVAGGVAVVVLATRDGGREEEPCRLPRVPAAGEAEGDAASAPGGGGLRVVEQAFTSITDDPLGPPAVSIGALVENTSAMVAYHTRVTFTMLDPAGAVVPDKEEAVVNSNRQVIPVIRPGQRVGVGSVALTAGRERRRPFPSIPVASVRITLESTHWVPPTSGEASFAPVTTRKQSSRRMFIDSVGPLQQGISVDYILTSGYCRPIAGAHGALLWRDSAGTLIGGVRASTLSDLITCRPGQRATWAVGRGVPKAADATKTEAYPYCDPGQPRFAPDIP